MRQKFLLFFCMMYCIPSIFAGTQHLHPQSKISDGKRGIVSDYWPGQCEITIHNQSYEPVQVYGIFDDGQSIIFNIFPSEPSHVISLFYFGVCHYEMYINIMTFNGYNIFSNYIPANAAVNIWSGYFTGMNAAIKR